MYRNNKQTKVSKYLTYFKFNFYKYFFITLRLNSYDKASFHNYYKNYNNLYLSS